jgi:hypothetical protein
MCLRLLGRVAHHLDAGLARAGERDHGHVRVAHEPVADRAAAPVHDVDTPGGTPASASSSTKRSPSSGVSWRA